MINDFVIRMPLKMYQAIKNGGLRMVFIAFYSMSNNGKDVVFASDRAIAERAGITHPTVSKHMKRLLSEGWIEIDEVVKARGGSVQGYRLSGKGFTTLSGKNFTKVVKKHAKVVKKHEKQQAIKQLINNTNTKKFLKIFNNQLLTNYTTTAIENNLAFWLKKYDWEEITQAVKAIKLSNFWHDKMTPVIFLRRKNPQGELVDYIDQFKNLKAPPPDHSEGIPITEWKKSPNYKEEK